MSKAPTGAQLWDNSTHIAKTQNSVPAAQTGRAQSAAKIHTRIDADKLLQFIGSGNLLRWLQDYYRPGEAWTKQGKRHRSKDGKVSLSFSDGVWIGKDFTGTLPDGSPIAILQKDKFLSYPAALEQLAREYNYQQLDSEAHKPTQARRKPQEAPKPSHPYRVNHDRNKYPQPRISARWEVDTAASLADYPKKISAEYLHRYGVRALVSVTFIKSGKRKKSRPDDPLYLIEGAGNNRKIYRPKAKKSKKQSKQLTASHAGNYCFGFDQLPTRCKHILITAGQNDTIAANMLLNHLGIYAVCLWSESGAAYLPPELLELLQSRCESVFVAYDDDKTGNRTAREIAELYSLDALFVPHYFGVNDFCDALEVVDPAQIVKAVQTEISALQPHIITGKLSNNKSVSGSLISFVEQADKCQLKAPTGIGKTFFVFNVLLPYLERKKKLLIFAVPYQAQGDQAQKDYTYKGQILPYIKEGSTAAHFAAVKDSPAVIVTYNSLYKLKEFYKGSTLVIDESHHLLNDASREFNFESCNDVFEAFDQVEKVICISGTPHDFMKDFGFKFFEVKQTDTTPIHLHRRSYTGKLFDNIFAHLEGLKYRKSAGLHCVLWDKIEKLIQLRDALVSMGVLRAEQIAILDSHRKQDDDYQSIKNTGRLPEKIRLVLTTRLIGDGVNIYDKPGDIILGDVRNKELFVQFPARFRKAKKVNVFSYREDKEHKLYIPSIKALRAAHESADKRLNEVLIYGQGAATKSHTKHIGHLKHDDFEKVYFSRDGVYKISEPLIYFNEIRRRDYQTGTDEFYQAICTEFPHFVMADQAAVEAAENETLQASQKATKRKKKDAEKHIIRKLIHDPETVLCAVADVCDFHTKRSISAMPAAAEPATRAEVVKFKKENLETLEQKPFAPVKRFVKLRSLGFDNTSAAAIVSRFNKGKLSQFHDRLVYNTWAFFYDVAPHLLTADERAKAVHYKKLYAALDPVIGAALTGDELAAAMQRFCPPGLTSNKAVTMAKRLYEVKEDRTAKGRKYILTERTDLTKVLQPFGLTVGEFLAKNRLNVEKTASAKNRNPLKISAVTKLKHIEKNSVTQLTIDLGEKYTAWWASPGATWNN